MARITIDLPDGSRFEGEVNDEGIPHGQGARTWPDGRREAGEYRDGEQVRGTYTWPDGCSFTGEFVGGVHTRGVYTWPDGSQFEGTYRDGQPARGVLTKADGAMQRGEFGPVEGGMFGLQGASEILLPDGTKFTNDDYRDGGAQGQGTAEYSDGSRYEGGWRNGKPHGQGVRTWPADGIRYEGAFVDGKAEGVGTWTYPDGSRYEGANRNDVPHGRGVRTWRDGRRVEGEWCEGQAPRRLVVTWPDGRRYEGGFVGGQPHGQGVLTMPDGRRIEGEWCEGGHYEGEVNADGEPHGQGVRTFSDGESIAGKWRDGELDGPWSAATINPRRLRIVSGPEAGKTVAGARKALRRRGVAVDEEAANRALAGALNYSEAKGLPLMGVAHGPDGPEVNEFEIIAPSRGAGRRRAKGKVQR